MTWKLCLCPVVNLIYPFFCLVVFSKHFRRWSKILFVASYKRPFIRQYVRMHECLCKTLSKTCCPHGEIAFLNSTWIYNVIMHYFVCYAWQEKDEKKMSNCMSTMGEWYTMISFPHSRQVYYGGMIPYDFIPP